MSMLKISFYSHEFAFCPERNRTFDKYKSCLSQKISKTCREITVFNRVRLDNLFFFFLQTATIEIISYHTVIGYDNKQDFPRTYRKKASLFLWSITLHYSTDMENLVVISLIVQLWIFLEFGYHYMPQIRLKMIRFLHIHRPFRWPLCSDVLQPVTVGNHKDIGFNIIKCLNGTILSNYSHQSWYKKKTGYVKNINFIQKNCTCTGQHERQRNILIMR